MRSLCRFLSALLLVAGAALPAGAQDAAAPDPNAGAVSVTASMDFVSTYMFRGIRQNSTGLAVQPVADVGVSFLSESTDAVSSVTLNIGTWNSLHSGDTGADAPSGNMWYEQDFYTTLSIGFGATTVGTTFTAYTSPNAGFTTVREIAFRVAFDDAPLSGRAALRPYGIVAFEFLAEPGAGQADGGDEAGTYLELGVAPGIAAGRLSIAFPVRLGMSLSNYYELRGPTGDVIGDRRFGYFGLAGIATLPLGEPSRFGAFSLRGGFEYQHLGETTQAFNGGESDKAIWSFGLAVAY